MAKFLIKTRGNADPTGKRKVYFTCHSEDFERYFEKTCEDIFRTHDCAIYYTEDMNEVIADEDKATDLGQMNLFVVPVTFKLLSKPNRAMDGDIAYAKQEHIPILPLMMEMGIDEFYGKPDKFGELQYLNPYSNDISEISYADKLKKYLESVLISDEMAQRIRKAFDAYIFLSYRKKDRRYANELMKLIHGIPEYRDIAIWYDEFLTPGESFQKNIEKALNESKLFALLVTPNLLEDPNFVMTEEYPAAKKADMTILPTEMVETDKTELQEKYEGIPECADPKEAEGFKKRFLEALEKAAISKAEHDPAHNFLIGLAYLDGIDMEIDRERGLKLITDAAENGLLEAMEKLSEIYLEGKGVQVDYNEAAKWAERIVKYCVEHYGERHPFMYLAQHNLASVYEKLNDKQKIEELKYIYNGDYFYDHIDWDGTSENDLDIMDSQLDETIIKNEFILDILKLQHESWVCCNDGNYAKALDLAKKAYDLSCAAFGKEHPDTLMTLYDLACTYNNLGEHQTAVELGEKCYVLRCKILGENAPDTLITLHYLAYVYINLSDHQTAVELGEKCYASRCRVLGEENSATLATLHNLAYAYNDLGEHRKALELYEKCYASRCRVLGEENSATLATLHYLADTYGKLGDIEKAVTLMERAYKLCAKFLGADHDQTLKSQKLLNEYRAKLLEQSPRTKQSF